MSDNDAYEDLAHEVRKVATMRPRGGSAQARVGAMVSALENIFLMHPHPEHLCLSGYGKYISYMIYMAWSRT